MRQPQNLLAVIAVSFLFVSGCAHTKKQSDDQDLQATFIEKLTAQLKKKPHIKKIESVEVLSKKEKKPGQIELRYAFSYKEKGDNGGEVLQRFESQATLTRTQQTEDSEVWEISGVKPKSQEMVYTDGSVITVEKK